MNLLVAAGSRLRVYAGNDMYEGRIIIRVEEHCGDAPVVISLPQERALELASKIESTYQGIVGPVEPESAPEYTGDLTGAPPPDPTRRCAFTAHDTGDRCTRQGTLGPGGVAYFCDKHQPPGGSCPHSGG